MEEAAQLLGIHPQTLRAWDRQGKIRVVRAPGGKRRVPEREVRRLQGEGAATADRPATWVVQARGSSHAQKARGDLARQAVHVRDRIQSPEAAQVVVITDIASGLSDRRPGLLQLTGMARRGEVTDIAVTYRDRRTRLGLGYLEEFFSGYGVRIPVVDGQKDRPSVQEELVADLIASVTSFSGKLDGLRSHGQAKARVEAVKGHVRAETGRDAAGA